MKISRRSLLCAAAGPMIWGVDRPVQGGGKNQRRNHTFVFITLQGGVDHAQFLPVFSDNQELSSSIHFPTQEVFEINGYRLLHVPGVLTPSSTLVNRFGARLAILSGVQMDGQNAHNGALKILMCGTNDSNALSAAAVLGELIGHDTKYGVVSFGAQPFQNSVGLSEKASGVTLPQKLSLLGEQLGLPEPLGQLTSERYLDLVVGYFRSRPDSDLNHRNLSAIGGSDVGKFRSIFRNSGVDSRVNLIKELSLTPDYWQSYDGLSGPYGSARHEQFAMTAKLINEGSSAACYVLNLGQTEGFHSYDTHNAYSFNDRGQQEKLARDLRAIEVFLGQIEPFLDTTTVIIGSEFGRTPALNAAQGRDHWGANNTILAISPFIKPGLHGSVDSQSYVGKVVAHDGNVQEAFRCRGIYRGLIEAVFARNLVNTKVETANRIYRQYLSGPTPAGVFNHA